MGFYEDILNKFVRNELNVRYDFKVIRRTMEGHPLKVSQNVINKIHKYEFMVIHRLGHSCSVHKIYFT